MITIVVIIVGPHLDLHPLPIYAPHKPHSHTSRKKKGNRHNNSGSHNNFSEALLETQSWTEAQLIGNRIHM